MSGFGNFALSFSVISILTGCISLYGFGLAHGGPREMTLGWPLVCVMTLAVAASLAELASAYPTAGALYHWATFLGGRALGWWTAWFNLVGQVAVVAGVDYGLAELACPLLGLSGTRGQVLSVYGVVLLSHGLLNHVGIRAVTILNELSAWYHLLGTALLLALVMWRAPLQPLSFLLTTYVAPEENGVVFALPYACLVGLLQAQWTLTGYDASAHVSEETVRAGEAAPRGIVSAVLVSAVAGWALLLGLTLAVQDVGDVASARNAFETLIVRALGPRLGAGMLWLVVGAMWFCGLSSVTSNSRMLYAFARDGGAPASRRLASVSARFGTPAWAVWASVVVAMLLAVWSGVYNVIVSISTIGLYVAYGIPIGLAWRARRAGVLKRGPWVLGRWSGLAQSVAVVWVAFVTVLFVLPPNVKTGVTFAGLIVVLLVLWFGWARRNFRGPPPRS